MLRPAVAKKSPTPGASPQGAGRFDICLASLKETRQGLLALALLARAARLSDPRHSGPVQPWKAVGHNENRYY
ncbi:MAG: hypothetical protein H0T73_20800 [Ardenticatenales bacterium]|nr:hypothetical protein [Ardenticatenales bacterium]